MIEIHGSVTAKYRSTFPHGIMFHRFTAEGALGMGRGDITPGELEQILDYVGVANILCPEEWLRRLRDGRLGPSHLCLTFDDGLRSQYDLALPVLERHGLKAFWFVYSRVFEEGVVLSEVHYRFVTSYFGTFEEFFTLFLDHCGEKAERLKGLDYRAWAQEMNNLFPFYSEVELRYRFIRNRVLRSEELDNVMHRIMREKGADPAVLARNLWLSEEHLRALTASGHEIGLHSHDHPYELSELPEPEQRHQYETNLRHIRRICSCPVRSAAHPLNSYSDVTLNILVQMGVLCAFRSNTAAPPGKKINSSGMEMAREDAGTLRRRLLANTR